MAEDSLHLAPLDRRGITSLTSDSVTETSMIDADPTIYQGARKSHSPIEDYRQHNVRTSTSGSDMRKEENNLLYAQTVSGTAIRHPTVRSVSLGRQDMYSMDTLDELSSSSSKCHYRCLAILLVITAIVTIAAIAVAVLAYVGEDECSCDQSTPVPSPTVNNNNSETIQSLNQTVIQLNRMTEDLSANLSSLLSGLTNLNTEVSIERMNATGMTGEPGIPGIRGFNGSRGPEGDMGPTGLPGLNGTIGPVGPPGVNETPTFNDVELFSNCTFSRIINQQCGQLCTVVFASLQPNQIVLDKVCLVDTNQTDATATYIIGDTVEACDCRVPTGIGICIAIEKSCSPNQSVRFL